jgi:hypothetical protein
MTPFGGYDSDFADQIRRMLQLGGTAPGVQNATMYNFSNPPPANGPGPGNVAPVPLSSDGNNPYAAAAAVPGPAPAPAPASPIAAQTPAPPPVPQVPPPLGPPGYLGSTSATPPGSPGSGFTPPDLTARSPVSPARAPAASSPAATSTAAPAAARRPQSPNLGYYPPNSRFGTMQSQVPTGRGPLGNNPIYTTMNLFGGGADKSASAANPKDVIPANAAASVPPNTYPGDEGWDVDDQGNIIPKFGDSASNAPWGYGPLQKGNIWKRSGGPHSSS